MTKRSVKLAIVTVILTGVWIAGCQEQQTSKDEKTYRLIGAENIQLKGENKDLREQIENLNQQLAKCEEEKQGYKHKAEVEVKESIEGVLGAAMERNVAQRDEIERLQAEIARLKGQDK